MCFQQKQFENRVAAWISRSFLALQFLQSVIKFVTDLNYTDVTAKLVVSYVSDIGLDLCYIF